MPSPDLPINFSRHVSLIISDKLFSLVFYKETMNIVLRFKRHINPRQQMIITISTGLAGRLKQCIFCFYHAYISPTDINTVRQNKESGMERLKDRIIFQFSIKMDIDVIPFVINSLYFILSHPLVYDSISYRQYPYPCD